MYTALYRRYRPGTFDEIVGQDHIVKILKNQISTGNISHAYLFCGTRGTGKTSVARIFAKGVNCLSEGEKPCGVCENCRSIQQGVFFDVIEIDAASNNRVDNIRELRESVKYPPAAGVCKVYIIDEVHMLSIGAFNALLKTLEEPPKHVIFVLATTEPHKLPATILSRCLRLDFRRVPETKIREKLKKICDELEITYEESALSLIAANGDGSVRDSLSILEQCIPAGEKTLYRKDVVEILGTAEEDFLLNITDMVFEGDTAGAFLAVEEIARDGKDIRQFIKDWAYHFRNLMMSKYAERLEDIMNMSCEKVERVKKQGEKLSMEFISFAITELSSAGNNARYSTQPRTILELAILKLSHPDVSSEKEALLRRIDKLEKAMLNKGDFAHRPASVIGEGSLAAEEKKEASEARKSIEPAEKSRLCKSEGFPLTEKEINKADERAEKNSTPVTEEENEDLKGLPKAEAKGSSEIERYLRTESDSEKETASIAESDSEKETASIAGSDSEKETASIAGSDSEKETASIVESDSKIEIPSVIEPSSSTMMSSIEEKYAIKDDNAAQSLWNEVFALALKERGSLKILENSVVAKVKKEDSLSLEVGSDLKKDYIEQNLHLFKKNLSRLTGKEIEISVVISKGKDNPTESLYKLIGDKLNVTE